MAVSKLLVIIRISLWFIPLGGVEWVRIVLALNRSEPFGIITGGIMFGVTILYLIKIFFEGITKDSDTAKYQWKIINGWLILSTVNYLGRIIDALIIDDEYWNLLEFAILLLVTWAIHQCNGLMGDYLKPKTDSSESKETDAKRLPSKKDKKRLSAHFGAVSDEAPTSANPQTHKKSKRVGH